MFHNMITRARDVWYSSSECTVSEIIDYMHTNNKLRDAQEEAIKTYLYLKIACNNKPLWELFSEGFFNTLNIDELEVSASVRKKFASIPGAQALFEYATLKNDCGEIFSEKLTTEIKISHDEIDYQKVFKDIFYNVSYPDYIFSLPMGAGKTFLMAAFIYLDLYFALNEPDNPVFAHNFIIFAPSGLKSSVVPSLKTIQRFDPTWVLPEPSASKIKKLIKFEILDQSKSEQKSNRTKNPNAQKISNYQPLDDLIGLVAVTNAEKVILDRIELSRNGQSTVLEMSNDEKDRRANELRNLIGKIPKLSIFIDEVHHASTDEIKLRAIVNKWSKNDSIISSVIGFSGTPYLQGANPVSITEKFAVKNIEISNVVYYYPLIKGIDNFLKRPKVMISNEHDSIEIITRGINDFLKQYKDKNYQGGLGAKLAIYCGKGSYGSAIDYLEEVVYPQVASLVSEHGMNPNETILKFHQGNKTHPISSESKLYFESLDKTFSKVRIILLVHIGKEGWDCRSLTGVILSQKGACPTNMVLQTSCRCLRQVEKGAHETALIWLNEANAKTLNSQLEQQQHISIKEFQDGMVRNTAEIERYSRIEQLKLPKVDFYQLKINYCNVVIDKGSNPAEKIENSITEECQNTVVIKEQTFENRVYSSLNSQNAIPTKPADYNIWLYSISKESFGKITVPQLHNYENILRKIFLEVTINVDGGLWFSSAYHLPIINANIRKAFYEKRELMTKEEIIPENADLLKIENLASPVFTDMPCDYYPNQSEVKKILKSDRGELTLDKKTIDAIKMLEEIGQKQKAKEIENECKVDQNSERTFHYLPYKTDSKFEQKFLQEILAVAEGKKLGIEVYYNGDSYLTDFRIKCYRGETGKWRYVGMYTPDFLIIKRKDGRIFKAIIVETKGFYLANDEKFRARKKFVESEFIKQNNERYGYNRFEFLYLQDDLPEDKRIVKTIEAIRTFFREEY